MIEKAALACLEAPQHRDVQRLLPGEGAATLQELFQRRNPVPPAHILYCAERFLHHGGGGRYCIRFRHETNVVNASIRSGRNLMCRPTWYSGRLARRHIVRICSGLPCAAANTLPPNSSRSSPSSRKAPQAAGTAPERVRRDQRLQNDLVAGIPQQLAKVSQGIARCRRDDQLHRPGHNKPAAESDDRSLDQRRYFSKNQAVGSCAKGVQHERFSATLLALQTLPRRAARHDRPAASSTRSRCRTAGPST